MAYVKKIFNENFLHYASYVIKDRAIPDLNDGLKPVQRRILHSLFEMDDGKFHKVANVVGHCMKYHPHGDASICSALVVLANKDLFIDKQGNYGNIFTGDEASASRYIECRVNQLAKEVLYNPKVTKYVNSYDGRNREPVLLPAKIPLVLIMGAEGIAVGMSTKILPHNPAEVLKAEIACLRGKRFKLEPDFPTGGLVDISEYKNGNGKIRVRAKLDFSDPKRIVIRELPFGSTTESLIESIESASRSGRIKIASISDFTSDKVEIEIKLQRGIYASEVEDALYAFTECEQAISCNCLVINNGVPEIMDSTSIIKHHSLQLLDLFKAELKLEEKELLDEIHARTLERIFIEERIYKHIENRKTKEAIFKAIYDGFKSYAKEIKREIADDDIERLLKIPIRRISLYDIEKARQDMIQLLDKLKKARYNLSHLVEYTIEFLENVIKKIEKDKPRKTTVSEFHHIDAKEVAKRDISLKYDKQSGYLGTSVSSGEQILSVSPYDKILYIRRNGIYTISPVPERIFADQELLYCAIAEKEVLSDIVFSIVFIDGENGYPYIKRCKIEAWILNKNYQLIPENSRVILFTTESKSNFKIIYAKKARIKIHEEIFSFDDFEVKGLKANGVKLASREAVSAALDQSEITVRSGKDKTLPDIGNTEENKSVKTIKGKSVKSTTDTSSRKKNSKDTLKSDKSDKKGFLASAIKKRSKVPSKPVTEKKAGKPKKK